MEFYTDTHLLQEILLELCRGCLQVAAVWLQSENWGSLLQYTTKHVHSTEHRQHSAHTSNNQPPYRPSTGWHVLTYTTMPYVMCASVNINIHSIVCIFEVSICSYRTITNQPSFTVHSMWLINVLKNDANCFYKLWSCNDIQLPRTTTENRTSVDMLTEV